MTALLGLLSERIQTIERQERKKEKVMPASQWAKEFRAVPSCPPTTAIRIMQGKLYSDAGYWAWIYYNCNVETIDVDFADPAGSEIYSATDTVLTLSWTNAGYYKPLILAFNYDWVFNRDIGPYDNGIFWGRNSSTEYETAPETEAAIDAILNGADVVYSAYRFPLCALVLKNNGQTDVDGAVLPVDLLNRGRSYIYRDIRPRNRITA